MRISDWSSDVCSSDLISSSVSPFTSRSNAFERAACSLCCWPQDFSGAAIVRAFVGVGADVFSIDGLPEDVGFQKLGQGELVAVAALRRRDAAGLESRRCDLDEGLSPNLDIGLVANAMLLRARSEEHTSELQSLMRISYAGFCLKTKKRTHTNASAHTVA